MKELFTIVTTSNDIIVVGCEEEYFKIKTNGGEWINDHRNDILTLLFGWDILTLTFTDYARKHIQVNQGYLYFE